jgi:methionyl-tRNA formyltransferase
MILGANLVLKTIKLLENDKIEAIDQAQFIRHEIELKSAPKIFKDTCELTLDKTVEQAYNFVRGLSPYPTAWTEIQLPQQSSKITLKIYEAAIEEEKHNIAAGTIITDMKKTAKIALKDGFLHLKQIQAPGKKRMEIGEYLRGIKMN